MVCVRMEGLARMFRAYMRTTHHVRHCCAQNADHLAHGSPLSAFFAEVVCSLAATPPPVGAWPPPNGGNGVIRGTTRRRHAANQLLMLQNPHRSQPRAPRRLQDLGAGPIGAKKHAQHRPFSRVSAKKLARHAINRQFWAIVRAQGELLRARIHHQTQQGEKCRTLGMETRAS